MQFKLIFLTQYPLNFLFFKKDVLDKMMKKLCLYIIIWVLQILCMGNDQVEWNGISEALSKSHNKLSIMCPSLTVLINSLPITDQCICCAKDEYFLGFFINFT